MSVKVELLQKALKLSPQKAAKIFVEFSVRLFKKIHYFLIFLLLEIF
jgi:hypothetical protein